MRVTKAYSIAVLAVVLALAGFVQWRASAAEAQEEKKAEAAQKAPPAAAGRRLSTVYLRGDAVGAKLDYIPTTGNLPRVQGELVGMDGDWVILSGKGKESMVARSAVLMIVTEGQ